MEIISLNLWDKLESSNFQFGSKKIRVQFSSVQSLSRVWLFATPWIAACQASLSITNTQSLLRLMPIKLVMPVCKTGLDFSLWISHYSTQKSKYYRPQILSQYFIFNFALIITEQHLVFWQKIQTISLAARGLSLGEFVDGLFEFTCTFNHLYTVMDILLSRYFLVLLILDFEIFVLLLKKKKNPSES